MTVADPPFGIDEKRRRYRADAAIACGRLPAVHQHRIVHSPLFRVGSDDRCALIIQRHAHEDDPRLAERVL